MEQIPPFYVGQEVEAISLPTPPKFSIGDRFLVTGVLLGCCGWRITIGITAHEGQYCSVCLLDVPRKREMQFNSSRFRAITPAFSEISFSKVMEEVLVSEN